MPLPGVAEHKVIHDSVHGSVKVEGVYLDILQRPEMQRLHGVHQLGLAHLVFPGAHHTRMEHSLGCFYVTIRMCDALGIDGEERRTVMAAALLHDIGHTPFSHTLEEVIEHRLRLDHTEMGRDIITGRKKVVSAEEERQLGPFAPLPALLEDNGLDPAEISSIIVYPRADVPIGQNLLVEDGQAHFNCRSYLRHIIHGPVDADQMDYLLRDAHYTGVAHGTIDLDRLLDTMEVHHGDLVIRKNGVVAVEGLMVARSLMYTSVYFHKTVRIAEMMMCKAVEAAPDDVVEGIWTQDDASLGQQLLRCGGVAARVMSMVRYRMLYKRAYFINTVDLTEEMTQSLLNLTDYGRRKEMEEDIALRAGVQPSDVIVDLPSREALLTESRIGKTEVPILDGDRVRALSKYSPLAKALQTRGVHDWAVMVSCPEGARAEVAKAAERSLSL
jgi:HD superfamily phosphohydrolase